MPRTQIPLQTLAQNAATDELTWTAADAANNHYFDNSSGRVILLWRNDEDAVHTGSIVAVADRFGRAVDDDFSVNATGGGASQVGLMGTFPGEAWNQSDGTVNVDIDDDTSFYFAAVKLAIGRP